MSVLRLIDRFAAWRDEGQPLVMTTVYATEGHTYAKTGARTLITADGDYQGLVSGGCLEGDLVEHARRVLRWREPRKLTYDMRLTDEDEIFGLGVGCDGMIEVLLQVVDERNGYQPFDFIAQQWRRNQAAVTGTVIESALSGIPAGATVLVGEDACERHEVDDELAEWIEAQCRERLADDAVELVTRTTDAGATRVLFAPLNPLPRLLVLGGGPDASPIIDFAHRVGWLVTVVDHRPTYIERGDFDNARAVLAVPDELDQILDLNDFAGAIVMSHHLATDRSYVARLAASDVPYIGLLGPRSRKQHLLDSLSPELRNRITGRTFGPAGLDIGADSCESIALAIVAEVHARMRTRTGRSLDA